MASTWGTSWGSSWLASWDIRTVSTPAWNCSWSRSWANSWGDTSSCEVPAPAAEEEATGGWEVLLAKHRIELRARKALLELAEERAEERVEARIVERDWSGELRRIEDAELDLEAAYARFLGEHVRWRVRYVEALRELVQQMEARRIAAMMAEAARIEAARIARNNENARRVLMLMTLQ